MKASKFCQKLAGDWVDEPDTVTARQCSLSRERLRLAGFIFTEVFVMEVHRRSSERRPYPAPRKNVLMLSCMDLRLIDDLCMFMEGDNLVNRYDQLVFAGSSLGVMQPTHAPWRDVFFQHLDIAVQLHEIQDVYIMEHRNCGAYTHFLGPECDFADTPEAQLAEEEIHRKYAGMLRDEILRHCATRIDQGGDRSLWNLNIRCFLMDLRGSARMLITDGENFDF